MIGFFKKLFGRDADTNKEAGVQIEQVSSPYKVETPVVDLADIAIAQRPEPVATATAPAVATTPKKQSAPKKQGAKPATGSKTRGRKPKAK
jgi:hypothetical protein